MSTTTFDQILANVTAVLDPHRRLLESLEWLVINRDLLGRVRLIAPAAIEQDQTRLASLQTVGDQLATSLAPHAHAAEDMLLLEADKRFVLRGASVFRLQSHPNVWIADRLATEGDWASIADESPGPARFVFFSIKGGVGRSTALAATAWSLAQAGKRVLVLDLDLESPGLSTSLLPTEKQPAYGITDWLVEDLVDAGDTVLDSMLATSDLSHDGEIYVVPAHGAEPGEYVAKLGRVWMPKIAADGTRESWSARLQRLLRLMESRIKPDVVLIDSRAGIDEVASTCVTDLGARRVMLFALEGSQTWTGYRVLFEHWRQRGVVERLRERLQIVGAMLPETKRIDYLEGLRDHAYGIFADSLYDEIAAGEVIGSRWHFEASDETAPHYPLAVEWHRSFAGLRSLSGRLAEISPQDVQAIFGALIEGVAAALAEGSFDD